VNARLRRWADPIAPKPTDAPWELAAEAIAIKIRWFGLVVGLLLANVGSPKAEAIPLNIILALGLIFTAVDTLAFSRGRVFFRDFPLVISAMEALFIGLLCVFESGDDSPFRFYYLLSLICTAIRYSPRITFITCGMDCLSYSALYLVESRLERDPLLFLLTLVILIWVTWAVGSLARYLKRTEVELKDLNAALRLNQSQLEDRIAERTFALEESQAQVLHQEKMAAFGLLAAGIAHEVGNPLTSISGIVQMLERRDPDGYTQRKLQLVTAELARIQAILRELIAFSRPTVEQTGPLSLADVVNDALRLAKFYKGGKNRRIVAAIPDDLPLVHGSRDRFVQVLFNLVLNAIDATDKSGLIEVTATAAAIGIELRVTDDGHGIAAEHLGRLFRPYFTTKKQGTGLGLFVIRRIVEEHGGTVTVSSTSGSGTTFTIALPASPQRELLRTPAATTVGAP